jgi:Taurine catabolism dioxygenase TauD, TfdA family
VNFAKRAPGGSAASQDVYKITLDGKVNQHPEYVHGTFFRRIDGVLIDQPLPKATLLSARKLTATGGQTEFANLYAALDHLPDWEIAPYRDARTVHTMASSMCDVVEEVNEQTVVLLDVAVPMEHPLIWTKEDGRQSLPVGSRADRIVGMDLPQGRRHPPPDRMGRAGPLSLHPPMAGRRFRGVGQHRRDAPRGAVRRKFGPDDAPHDRRRA